ncbi:baseplate J/gp47 family protein [Pseudomonas kurunegalensis]|uniref:baseplate J/gp47 family protein n=1 Tax=Pseudomonas kurunegalensis TaxID=485880 RepID=UPI00256FE7C4|nr:baseplate J/gp47 family protein [Pseudomonas kurunegalensis]WJD60883.1 baseplate J/gp47 family protein [Pseudomonas kurunegalensis]
MSTWTPIDLSQLPEPSVVEILDYEVILEERKAHLISLWPAEEQADIARRLELESEPLTKLVQENAYREMIWRQRVNQAALANLLAYATGTDLEQLAANFNVERLLVTAADSNAIPPIAAVWETDDALRERTQMAMEGLSTAGPRNAYILHARNASGRVADASAISPSPACVTVSVLSVDGEGVPDQDLLTLVRNALNDEDVRPLGDRLTVQAAQVLPYSITATIHLGSLTAEAELIEAQARDRLTKLVTKRRRLGLDVRRSALDAAMHVDGVRFVELAGWTDIVPNETQAPWCTAINLTVVEVGE